MPLLVWFKFDDNSNDSHSNSLDLTETNTPTYVSGKVDQAGKTTSGANNSWIKNDFIAELDNLSEFTVAVWIRYLDTPATSHRFLHIHDGTYVLVRIGFTATQFVVTVENDSGTAIVFSIDNTSIVFDTDQLWHHLIITFDGTTLSVYLDNVILGTPATGSITPLTAPTTLEISVDAFDCEFDDLRLLDYIISSNERKAIYNSDEYVIDGYSYLQEFRDGDINQTALFRIRSGEIILSDDVSNTILGRLDNGQDIHIYNNYELVFRGLVESFDFTESKQITIYFIDYSFYLAEDFPTYVATAETASTIVTNLINSYGNNLFSLNIATTTKLYTKTWRAFSPLEIIQELALNESFTFFVTQTREFNFKSQGYNRLGVTLIDGTTIYKRDFPHDNTKLKNVIIVIGKGATDTAGIRTEVSDPDSVSKHGRRTKRVEDTSIETEDAAIERAEAELNRLANPLIIGSVLTARNFSYTSGSVIVLTVPQKNWLLKDFLIIEAKHELEIPMTTLFLAEINILNSDQIADILLSQRIVSKNWEDDATPITKLNLWKEFLTVEMYAYVETQSTETSREWNQNEWDDNLAWDIVPGSWQSTDINGEKMTIMDKYLNRIRDLTVGKAVTDLDSINSHIAIGSGTTPTTINDQELGEENYREAQDGGFPQDGASVGENEWQSSWSDSDFLTDTFNEMGIFDLSSISIDCTANTITFADANPDTISRANGSWITDGLEAGDKLTVNGSTSNDGNYTIDTISALVITLISADTLVAETNTTDTIIFSGGGDLMARAVPTTVFRKSVNENMRVRFKLVLVR